MCHIYYFLSLAILGTLLLGLAYSQEVKISVPVSRREISEVDPSPYTANASKELIGNFEIKLKINSKNLIDAFGNVKETVTNNSVELICDASSKDEEIKKCESSKEEEIRKSRFLKEVIAAREKDYNRLWQSHCSEEGQEFLDVFTRRHRNAVRKNRKQVAKCVIVDGNGHLGGLEGNLTNIEPMDNLTISLGIESSAVSRYSSAFIMIRDEGWLSQIPGEEEFNDIEKGGLGSNYLLVWFRKENRNTPPSKEAMKTFKELLRTAVCLQVLSPKYYIVPFYLIGDYYSIGNESFERNALSKWVGYKDSFDFLFTSNKDENGTQPIVSNLELSINSLSVKDDSLNISSPIDYLVVTNYATRCFFNCGYVIKAVDRGSSWYDKILDTNFWVAEDGRAYELYGWGKTTQRVYQSKKAAVVAFMGHFNNYRPNKRIFDAFEDLIEEGLRLGKLSPTFKIVSIRNPNANPMNSGVIGNSLEKEIRKHPRFSDTF